jgi:hypothetical protein
MANRVLCIGIGSTGLDICRDLVERVELEWGGLERTPWLRVLSYETKDVTAQQTDSSKNSSLRSLQRLKNRGIIRRWSLQESEVQALKRQANSGQLPADYDPAVIERMKPLAQGAGNIRMAGRILARHPSNSRVFYSDVSSALKDLSACTNHSASMAAVLHPDGSPATITLDAGEARPIEVYLVGHAAGGTASGSMIDMAHFVRAIARQAGYTVNITGFILLPDVNNKDKNQVANAYAMLRELNHYARKGVRWSGGFSGVQGYEQIQGDAGQMPFDVCSLISPDAKPAEDGKSRDEMIDSVSQFIYHAAMTNLTVDDRFINPDQHRAFKMLTENAPERFCSIATAIIQYPATTILKGCTSKLGANTTLQWLGNSATEDHLKKDVRKCLGLEVEGNGPGVALARNQDETIRSAKNSKSPSDVINRQWAGMVSEADKLIVPISATDAQSRLLERLLTACTCLEEGPIWMKGFLAAVPGVFDALDATVDKARADEEKAAKQQAVALAMLRDVEDSLILKIWPFTWWRRMAIEKHAKAWYTASARRSSYYLSAGNAKSLAKIRSELISHATDPRPKLLSLIERRLDNVKIWLQELNLSLTEDYLSSLEANTSANGITLKEADEVDGRFKQFIDEKYLEFAGEHAPGRTPEEACRAVVAADLGKLLDTRNLFSKERSVYDNLSAEQKGQLGLEFSEDPEQVKECARPLFNELFKINVLDLLMNRGKPAFVQAITDVLKNKGKPFIEPDGDLLVEGAPWDGSDAAPIHVLLPGGVNFAHAQEAVLSPLTGFSETRGAADGNARSDPNLMLVVRAQTLFSIASLKILEEYKRWYDKYAEDSGVDSGHAIPGMQVRYDLHYVSPEHVSEHHRNRTAVNTGLFLTGLALGVIDSVDFTYKTRMGLYTTGEKTFRFSRSILESVELLNENQRLQQDLEQVFKSILADDPGAERTAESVGEFQKNNSGGFKLKYNEMPVTPERIHSMLRPFGKKHRFWTQYLNYLQIQEQVNRPFIARRRADIDEENSGDILLDPHPYKNEGFYCPQCFEQLQSFKKMQDHVVLIAGGGEGYSGAELKAKGRLPEVCPFCGSLFSVDSDR